MRSKESRKIGKSAQKRADKQGLKKSEASRRKSEAAATEAVEKLRKLKIKVKALSETGISLCERRLGFRAGISSGCPNTPENK